MRKNVTTKLITLLMAFVLMVTAVPMGNVTANAATKPGSVGKVKITKVTKNSARVTYKRAKKAKGYQIRVYKGKKQVLSKKTKALYYNIKKLKPNTKYTVKVRAYNGKKYGKEKSIKFKTKKNTTTNPTPNPEPEEPEPEPDNPTPPAPQPPLPGTSTSEGKQLVAEYNAYVTYIAADWSDVAAAAIAFQDSSITCLNTAWLGCTAGMINLWHYSDMYTDKYQAYKHGCGTLDAITDYYADVLTACGLTVTVNIRDPKEDYDRYNKLYASDVNNQYYYDSRIHKALMVTTQDGKTNMMMIVPAPSRNGLAMSMINTALFEDGRTIVGTCPGCGNEIRRWESLTEWQKHQQGQLLAAQTTYITCQTCKKNYYFNNPYYDTDLNKPVYIRTATFAPDDPDNPK